MQTDGVLENKINIYKKNCLKIDLLLAIVCL